jgi:hypothetical protein
MAIAAGALAVHAAAEPGEAKRAAPSTATTAGEAQTTAARRKRRRPGCNKFCRQAGGFGAPPGGRVPVRVETERARVGSDGIVGIRARCTLAKTCDGAILLDGKASYGRANLRIAAGKTRTVLVLVPRAGRRYLRRNGRDRSVFATVPLKSNDPVSASSRFTLLPRR